LDPIHSKEALGIHEVTIGKQVPVTLSTENAVGIDLSVRGLVTAVAEIAQS
jgi:hypothetical protein